MLFFLEFIGNPNSSILKLSASFIVKSISELSKMIHNCVNQRRINIMWLVNSQLILGTNSSMASLYWSLIKKNESQKNRRFIGRITIWVESSAWEWSRCDWMSRLYGKKRRLNKIAKSVQFVQEICKPKYIDMIIVHWCANKLENRAQISSI